AVEELPRQGFVVEDQPLVVPDSRPHARPLQRVDGGDGWPFAVDALDQRAALRGRKDLAERQDIGLLPVHAHGSTTSALAQQASSLSQREVRPASLLSDAIRGSRESKTWEGEVGALWATEPRRCAYPRLGRARAQVASSPSSRAFSVVTK